MKNLKISLLALFAGLFIIGYQTSCGTAKGAANNQSSEKGLLWEIKVPGAKAPSYVYGTIHMIEAADYFLPQGTMTSFEKSQKIFFEIDMAQMTDMSAMMGLMNQLFMKDGVTLKSLLDENDYQKVSEFFNKKGMPIMFLEKMKPMFLMALTYADMGPGGLQNGDIKSYEFEFLEMAKNTKKPTGGLETIEFQLGVFDKIPYDTQAKMLVDAIDQSGEGNDELDKMVEIYKAQDIEKLVSMIGEPESGVAEYEDVLLHERNKNWIPIMLEEAKKQPSFFAVGAGHLGGKTGVLSLLRAQGVKVQRVVE